MSVRLSALSIRRSVCCPFFRRPFLSFFSSLFHLLSLSLLLSLSPLLLCLSTFAILTPFFPSFFPPLFTLSLLTASFSSSAHVSLPPSLHESPTTAAPSQPSLFLINSISFHAIILSFLIINREPFSSLLTYPSPNPNTSSLAFDCPAGRGTHHYISFPPFHTTPSPVCKSQ